MKMNDRTFTVRDLCERYSVNQHNVLGWIRSGELRAINVGRRIAGKRPRWRVTQEALNSFELLRASTPPPPPVRRQKLPADFIKFY
jgi:Helix-turn-helix domain